MKQDRGHGVVGARINDGRTRYSRPRFGVSDATWMLIGACWVVLVIVAAVVMGGWS